MKRLKAFLQRRKSRAAEQSQQPLQQSTPVVSDNAPAQPVATKPVMAAAQHENVNQAALNVQATAGTLSIALHNNTSSSTVYAYITGQAIDNRNALFLLKSDAVTPYYPASPSSIQQPLQADCAIALGAPGRTVLARIPHIAGGRIWFSINSKLTFHLNPGPALVEPSVTNPSDPNIHIDWTFAEFTFNADQLYANISYVDFVSLPVSLTLNTIGSGTQKVLGLSSNGLKQIADGLIAQNASDHQGWNQLVVNRQGTTTPLRILSPNLGTVINPNLFANYYSSYVDQVFARYATQPLTIDTQSGFGKLTSKANPSQTITLGTETFTKPSTRDVFSCSTGPFATGSSALRNTIIPRLAAAFNRSTLLATASVPAPAALYYKAPVTNHYSRLVHAANLDGKGYAFPYDDVQAAGDPDQSGKVQAGDPKLFIVTVGAGQS